MIPVSFICSADGILKPASHKNWSKPYKQSLRQTAARKLPRLLLTNKSLKTVLGELRTGRGRLKHCMSNQSEWLMYINSAIQAKTN